MLLRVDNSWAPEELRPHTTATFAFISDGQSKAHVGVMRPTGLGDPWLWLDVHIADKAGLRACHSMLEELHRVLNEPVLMAEVDTGNKINERFAEWAGFKKVFHHPERSAYRREI